MIHLKPKQPDKTLKGKPLRVAVSISARMQARIQRSVDAMIKTTERAIVRLFNGEEFSQSYAMDANIGSQARIVMNGLYQRFDDMFRKISTPISEQMIKETEKNSATTLKSSLSDIAGALTIPTDFMTATTREIIKGASYEAAHLIKRVPAKYLDNIANGVYRAIVEGRGLADIVPLLEKQKVSVSGWVKNVSMDMVRKTYTGLNRERMQSIGIEEYRWSHSGGSNHPRPYHRDVLNGKVFRWDDPPFIEPPGTKNRKKGHVGSLPYCRCNAIPQINFAQRLNK